MTAPFSRPRIGTGRPSGTANVELPDGPVLIGVLGDYIRLLPEPAVAPEPVDGEVETA